MFDRQDFKKTNRTRILKSSLNKIKVFKVCCHHYKTWYKKEKKQERNKKAKLTVLVVEILQIMLTKTK